MLGLENASFSIRRILIARPESPHYEASGPDSQTPEHIRRGEPLDYWSDSRDREEYALYRGDAVGLDIRSIIGIALHPENSDPVISDFLDLDHTVCDRKFAFLLLDGDDISHRYFSSGNFLDQGDRAGRDGRTHRASPEHHDGDVEDDSKHDKD